MNKRIDNKIMKAFDNLNDELIEIMDDEIKYDIKNSFEVSAITLGYTINMVSCVLGFMYKYEDAEVVINEICKKLKESVKNKSEIIFETNYEDKKTH